MREIELCMKYDTCRRCPLNKRCEDEYQQREKQRQKDREQRRKEKRKYDE